MALAFFQIVLIIGVLLFSYFGWIAQRRNAIRQAIEDIEHIELNSNQKIVPSLGEYEFRPSPHKVHVIIEEYDLGSHPESASLPGAIYFGGLSEELKVELKRVTEEQEAVETASIANGFSITFRTNNEVIIKNGTAGALRAIWAGVNLGVDQLKGVSDPSEIDTSP